MSATLPRSTVVGVFEDRRHADQAVSELIAAGFPKDKIGIAMRHAEGETGAEASDAGDTHAGSGALTGALTGLGLGALAGLGVLAGIIPVVGPAIAAGTLGVVLSNAAAGAGLAGLVGALVGAGLPEHEAKYYHDELEAGRAIVTVTAEGRADEATTILRRAGAYDMESQGSAVRSASGVPTGSSLTSTSASASTAPVSTGVTSAASGRSTGAVASTTAASRVPTATTHAATGQAGDTIQVKEERLRAEKTAVETGAVTVRKEVHTETKTIEVPVEREEIVIERTPVHGRTATTGIAAGDIREGEQIRIPVREEQVSVHKDAVVVEEVKVGKRVVHDTERVTGEVRKEEVKVEQAGDVDIKTRGKGNASS